MTTAAIKPSVTPEQVAFYHENGFLLIPNLLPAETLQALRDETDRIVSEAAGLTDHDARYDLEDSHTPDDPRVRRLKTPHAHWPFFRELAQHPALMEVVTALIGPNVRLQSDKLNMKEAQYGAPVEWHQDWPFYPHTNDDLLAAGVLLDDCYEQNGPLLVVPGSHKRHIYDHHHPEGRYFTGAVEPSEFDWDMQRDLVSLEGPGRLGLLPPRAHDARFGAQSLRESAPSAAVQLCRGRRLADPGPGQRDAGLLQRA